MRHQFLLDPRPEFQDMVSDLLAEYKTVELGVRITKTRIFVASLWAAANADLDTLLDLANSFEPMNPLVQDRKFTDVPHPKIFIYAKQLDYVKYGIGRLAIEREFRFIERDYLCFCVRYFNTLDRPAQIAFIIGSDALHPVKQKKRRPNGYRDDPSYVDEPI